MRPAASRTHALEALARETFDLLVVGGGVAGAGIAREAALRGLSVALVERGDFASGTSGRTSRLIHGGLRYLKLGQFRFVRKSIRAQAELATAEALARDVGTDACPANGGVVMVNFYSGFITSEGARAMKEMFETEVIQGVGSFIVLAVAFDYIRRYRQAD